MDVSFLQKNYIVVLLSVLFALFYTFVMNLLLPESKQQNSYIKSVVLSGLLSSAIVYLHNLDPPVEVINLDPVPF